MPNNAGMEQITPVEKAALFVGGLTALARMLGVSAPTVHEWKTLKRPVPARRCTAIERLTGGEVTRKDLRPDDYLDIWPELAVSPSPAPHSEIVAEVPLPQPVGQGPEAPPWDGVDRRDFLQPAALPAELERRKQGVEATGQGV